jgi:hypothetical protein
MSRSKEKKDFAAFGTALTAATASASPPAPAVPEPSPPDLKRGRGRPVTGNEQITLRLPVAIREKLVERVGVELARTGRITTLQQVILRILEKELNG